jgi:uncharacterized protein YdhG (YjbR/CyaY superfamily)
VSPIDGYLARLKGPRRTALQKLRKQIRSVVPRAEECISYRIPAFRVNGAIVAGFLARKDGCSYVPFSGSTLGTLEKELDGYSQTKSSLHFAAEDGLPLTLVRKLVKTRLKEIAERGR